MAYTISRIFYSMMSNCSSVDSSIRLKKREIVGKNCCKYRINSKFIGTVVLKIRRNGLVDHLQQVFRGNVFPERGCIVCLEQAVYKPDQSRLDSEFLDQEETGIRCEVTVIKINFHIGVALQCGIF